MEKINLESINDLKREAVIESFYLHLILFKEYFYQELSLIFGTPINLKKLKKLLAKSQFDFGSVESAELVVKKIKSGELVSENEVEEAKSDLENFLSDIKRLKNQNKILLAKKKFTAWLYFGPGKYLISFLTALVIFILFIVPFLNHFSTGKELVKFAVSLSNFVWKWIFILLISASALVIIFVFIIFALEKKARKKS